MQKNTVSIWSYSHINLNKLLCKPFFENKSCACLVLAGPGQTVYSANTAVSCASAIPQVTCIFVNRCNQTRNTSAAINIIKGMFQY